MPITGQLLGAMRKVDHRIEATLILRSVCRSRIGFNSKRYFLGGKIILQMRNTKPMRTVAGQWLQSLALSDNHDYFVAAWTQTLLLGVA